MEVQILKWVLVVLLGLGGLGKVLSIGKESEIVTKQEAAWSVFLNLVFIVLIILIF